MGRVLLGELIFGNSRLPILCASCWTLHEQCLSPAGIPPLDIYVFVVPMHLPFAFSFMEPIAQRFLEFRLENMTHIGKMY